MFVAVEVASVRCCKSANLTGEGREEGLEVVGEFAMSIDMLVGEFGLLLGVAIFEKCCCCCEKLQSRVQGECQFYQFVKSFSNFASQ